MRRIAVSVVAVVLTAVAMPNAVGATVVSNDGLPIGLSTTTQTCGSDNAGPLTLAHVNGPGRPPLGTGSLAVHEGTGTGEWGIVAFPDVLAADLTTIKISHDEPTTNPATVLISLQFNSDGHFAHNDQLNLQPAASHGVWRTEDLLDTGLYYYRDGVSQPSESYSDYVAANPESVLVGISYLVTNCIAASSDKLSYMDAFEVGVSGKTTTYDFEAPGATLRPSVSTAKITAGRSTTVKVEAKSNGSPVVNEKVQLFGKAHGDKKFHLLATRPTNAKGEVVLTEHPSVATTYRWLMPPVHFAPATSATRTVSVRTKVTAKVKDKTLTSSQPVVVTGRTYAPRSRSKIELRRKTGAGSKLVQRVKVARNGSFRFSHTLPAGKQKLFVAIGAGQGELAGKSAAVTVHAT